jgi:hypothetical protein
MDYTEEEAARRFEAGTARRSYRWSQATEEA